MLRTKIHIALSAIGTILGLSAFICFCIVYANIEAGMWALLSGKCCDFHSNLKSISIHLLELQEDKKMFILYIIHISIEYSLL